MKEKYLWGGIFIALLCWIGNYVYFQSQQLDEPIFLDHYYEIPESDHVDLTFYYITNKQFTADIRSITIKGVEAHPNSTSGFLTWNNELRPRFEQEFTHQYLRSVTVDLPASLIKEKLGKANSFDKMTVFFSNGETITADIGQVNIYPPEQEQSALKTEVSGSNNQHRNQTYLVATKNIKVNNITIPFSDKISNDVAIKFYLDQELLKQLDNLQKSEDLPDPLKDHMEDDWNDVPGITLDYHHFTPFSLNVGDWMNLYMQFNPTQTSAYHFSIKVKGTTNSGEDFTYNVPIIEPPTLDEKAIDQIITEKQGGILNDK